MTIQAVREVLIGALQIKVNADAWGRDTLLLGHLPELDSMAVVTVITSIEEEFDIVIEDDEISADVFESLGSLTDFVAGKMNGEG